jgi:hypothetical protein
MIEDSHLQSGAWMSRLRAGNIPQRILTIRGHRIMLDFDLAELYGVPTKVFNQAIQRNAERFPEDFMFQLSRDEADSLRSQIMTLKTERGKHRKSFPTRLPSKASQCSPASFAVNEQFKSILPSCERLSE